MQLQDSFSLFILPFTFKATNFRGIDENAIWERSKIAITDNFFFSQVRNYLGANLTQESIDADSALIYDLKDSFNETSFSSIAQLFKKRHTIVGTDSPIEFKFCIQKRKLTSPKLLLFPLTSVGMVVFGIELCKEPTMERLMELNYRLEKYKIAKTNLEIVPNSDRLEEANQIELIYSALETVGQAGKQSRTSWSFSQLISFFTADLTTLNIKLSNSGRFHIFTYCQIDSKGNTDEALANFGRIVRCQNENYNPVMTDIDGRELVRQTFDNIYIGSCVEGAGIMVDTHSSRSLVLEQYKDSVLTGRYLWTYILVYHQRLALCNMIEQLSCLNINRKTTKDSLLGLVSQFSKIMIKTRFTDISDFTQHNSYYKFCMNNLGVRDYYNDLDEKLRAIDNVVDEKNDKDLANKNKKFEKLALLLLVPQIVYAFFTLNVDFFGAQATPNEFLQWLYGSNVVAAIIYALIVALAIPAFYLGGIVLIDFFRKDRK